MIVVIDGPAGSGKSSTARAVADRMKIQYLDSGALYRTLTLIYLEAGRDKEQFFEILKEQSISFDYREGLFHTYINKEEVTESIRSEAVAAHVSEVAAMPGSREVVNKLMREVIAEGIYIAEGRDLGTVVFPNAALKFFMVADTDTRAERRYREMKEQGMNPSLEAVRQNIEERDRKDSTRSEAPLRKAEDALEVDTSEMKFEQQVAFICSKIEELLTKENINKN